MRIIRHAIAPIIVASVAVVGLSATSASADDPFSGSYRCTGMNQKAWINGSGYDSVFVNANGYEASADVKPGAMWAYVSVNSGSWVASYYGSSTYTTNYVNGSCLA